MTFHIFFFFSTSFFPLSYLSPPSCLFYITNVFYLHVLSPRDFNTTPFLSHLCPSSVGRLTARWSQFSNLRVEVVLKKTSPLTLSLHAILVPLLCSHQGVIAEDTREGLSSCPFDATMVTRSHSQLCRDKQIQN